MPVFARKGFREAQSPAVQGISGRSGPSQEVFSTVKDKVKFSLFLTPETRDMVTAEYKKNNCSTQSEFIEKAIRFFVGYLHADEDGNFLPEVLSQELDGKLELLAKRIGRMLFKLSVDDAVMSNLIAYETGLDRQKMLELRNKCIQDVRRTNGEIDLMDAYQFQKGDD